MRGGWHGLPAWRSGPREPWYVAPMPLGRVLLALLLAGCGSRAATTEADQTSSGAVAVPAVQTPTPGVAAALTLASRYPSVGYYPDPHPSLLKALEARDPLGILDGLARTFAPVRPHSDDWDRSGHLRLTGETTGFVRETGGSVAPQPPGRYDLSCAGGFLEAVRLLLLPRIELDDFARCDDVLLASVDGSPKACGHDGDFGLLALVNIAAQLEPDQLPAGRTIEAHPVRNRADVKADVPPGHARLCTVSHESTTHERSRYHHHMMLMLEPDENGEIPLFDTTGYNGVHVRSRPHNLIAKYAKHALADNKRFGYDRSSAVLSCLTVKL